MSSSLWRRECFSKLPFPVKNLAFLWFIFPTLSSHPLFPSAPERNSGHPAGGFTPSRMSGKTRNELKNRLFAHEQAGGSADSP